MRLPAWLLALSIIIDMALLFGLIWSFHLQYAQPPSFYLKAPTLLYVFIFIALRALRFEAKYVVFAGLAAALGWLAMVLYVVFVDPDECHGDAQLRPIPDLELDPAGRRVRQDHLDRWW